MGRCRRCQSSDCRAGTACGHTGCGSNGRPVGRERRGRHRQNRRAARRARRGPAWSQRRGSVGVMGRWWTSDHHFGHANIIRYCARPFANADAMNRAMVDRWNDVVDDSDEVWILGDLVWGSSWRTMAGCVARLRGRKVLVPGNHDRCWVGRDNHASRRADYFNIGGIDEIVDDPEPHVVAGEAVMLNHFPYRTQSRYDLKFMQYRPQDDGGLAAARAYP